MSSWPRKPKWGVQQVWVSLLLRNKKLFTFLLWKQQDLTLVFYFAGMSSHHRLSWRIQWCRFKRRQRLHLSRGTENSGRKMSWPRSLFHGHCSRSLWRWHSSLCRRWSLSWSQKVSHFLINKKNLTKPTSWAQLGWAWSLLLSDSSFL